ncbi:hypothetical protein LTR49_028605 [Elasticomyces elasticus]|nr:hypothetical protein LTR49_028605 [Elasticomyces elasticus]
MSGLERQTSHSDVSPKSESVRNAGSTGKNRACRARTRSVKTLSASQLERKHANDREAQRAICQQTKKHIESLELRGSQEFNEKIIAVTQQRNRDLEDELAYLRSKLHEGGHEAEAPLMHSYRRLGEGVVFAHLTSRVEPTSATSFGIKRATSTSTSRNLSVATASTDQKSMGGERFLIWGPHDTTGSGHTMQAPPPQAQEPLSSAHSTVYRPVYQSETQEWVRPTQRYHHQGIVGSELQRAQRSETQHIPLPASQSVHHQHVQPPIQSCTPTPSPPLALQRRINPAAQLPPQAENQGMSISRIAYQVQQPHTYQHAAQQRAYSHHSSQAPDPGLSRTKPCTNEPDARQSAWGRRIQINTW